MSTHDLIQEELILIHAHIQALFRGEYHPDTLSEFMTCFCTDFRMVTINGQVIDCAELLKVMPHSFGMKPGLIIEIDDVTMATDNSHGNLSLFARLRQKRMAISINVYLSLGWKNRKKIAHAGNSCKKRQ